MRISSYTTHIPDPLLSLKMQLVTYYIYSADKYI